MLGGIYQGSLQWLLMPSWLSIFFFFFLQCYQQNTILGANGDREEQILTPGQCLGWAHGPSLPWLLLVFEGVGSPLSNKYYQVS